MSTMILKIQKQKRVGILLIWYRSARILWIGARFAFWFICCWRKSAFSWHGSATTMEAGMLSSMPYGVSAPPDDVNMRTSSETVWCSESPFGHGHLPTLLNHKAQLYSSLNDAAFSFFFRSTACKGAQLGVVGCLSSQGWIRWESVCMWVRFNVIAHTVCVEFKAQRKGRNNVLNSYSDISDPVSDPTRVILRECSKCYEVWSPLFLGQIKYERLWTAFKIRAQESEHPFTPVSWIPL